MVNNGRVVPSTAYGQAVTPNKSLALTRRETSGGNQGVEGSVVSLTFTNAHATESRTYGIGDLVGLCALQRTSWSKTDLTIAGANYGASTEDIFKALHTRLARFQTMHVDASDASFFTTGSINILEANPNGQDLSSKRVNFALAQTPDQYNSKIQVLPNFKYAANPLTAIEVTIPAGHTVTISMKMVAYELAGNMVEIA